VFPKRCSPIHGNFSKSFAGTIDWVRMFLPMSIDGENSMSRLGIFGATALSLSLAIASPALAQHARGAGGMHGGGAAMHTGAGNFGGMRAGGPAFAGSQANFRGAQANANVVARPNVTAGPSANVAARPGGEQFARGGYGRGEFRGDRDRGFGTGAGFAAGVVAGSALGYGGYGYGYGYDPYWYGDDYAFDTGYYDPGFAVSQAVVPAEVAGPDSSWCAAHYRSYDPATGTYLGFDGLRHPCP
jgi:BA14K-like protein